MHAVAEASRQSLRKACATILGHNQNFPRHGAAINRWKSINEAEMASVVSLSYAAPQPSKPLRSCTPSRRIRLKARIGLGDQTVEFIPFEVISTAILTYFYLLLGTNVRILVSVINTRFQPDAPRRCKCAKITLSSMVRHSRYPSFLHRPRETCLCPPSPCPDMRNLSF